MSRRSGRTASVTPDAVEPPPIGVTPNVHETRPTSVAAARTASMRGRGRGRGRERGRGRSQATPNEPEPSVQASSASGRGRVRGRGRGRAQATTETPVDIIAQEVTKALQAALPMVIAQVREAELKNQEDRVISSRREDNNNSSNREDQHVRSRAPSPISMSTGQKGCSFKNFMACKP
ncbi:hypothetical protein L6452_11428 [Arctium lappa]|uniref:Uncharacterized protein n=1 Tax=Arctium lappa TaxID=4217 RepID=A0ACB9DQ21_ARCLA|nr:hypothetical protein L6452_11428 [Arctium lappa]